MKTKSFLIILFVLSIVAIALPIRPTTAATKTEFSGTEICDPFGILGPPQGAFLALGTVTCPGYEPTGNPLQPCPPGSRTNLRNGSHLSRAQMSDARLTGWLTIEDNSNWDADSAGPEWGGFTLVVDSGGTWQGRWNSQRVKEGDQWVHFLHCTAHGIEGPVQGLEAVFEDRIVTFQPVPFFTFGTVEGEIIDPHSN